MADVTEERKHVDPEGMNPPGLPRVGEYDGVPAYEEVPKLRPMVGYDPTPPKVDDTDHLIKYLMEQRDANRRLTRADVEKLRRRQRTQEIVSGIGDAVRGLSNLYFTSQYAPNMYDHTRGLSAASKARWDRTWKEREAENERWHNYALQIHGLQAQRAATEYQREQDAIKTAREDIKLELAQAKTEMDAAKNDVWMKVQLGKMDKDAADTEMTRIQADYAKKYGVLMGRMSTINHSGGGKGKGGSTKEPKVVGTLPDENGNEKPYYNNNDYKAAVEEMHPATGESPYYVVESGSGFSKKKTQKPKTSAQKAADIKRANRGKGGGGDKQERKHADL